MGDINAKVQTENIDACTRGFRLVIRNARGDRLIECCQNNDFLIKNRLFKLP